MIITNCAILHVGKLSPEQGTFPGPQSLTRDSLYPIDRGLIVVNSNLSYIIEPLPDSGGYHLIYRSEHLKLPPGNCGFEHSGNTSRDWGFQFTNQIKKRPHRVSSRWGVTSG